MSATQTTTPEEQKTGAEPQGEQPQQPQGRTFTQAELDAIVTDRLNREKAQREKAEERARADAEAKALADQAKFKELADQQARRLAELEPLETKVEEAQSQTERYKAALTSILEQQRAGIPAPIISLLDRMDPVEQLEWIAANQEAVAAPRGNGAVPPSPRGTGLPNLTREEAIKAERERRRASGIYS